MTQPTPRPLPEQAMPDELDAPFWEACNRSEFVLHRCTICDRHYWPASCCVDHGGRSMEWVPATGRGVVETSTVFHRQYHPAFPVPYNVVVVRLEEGPYFHSTVVECDLEALEVGMAVEVTFDEIAPGVRLPVFVPADRAT
jgi:uncharacterized OB-fold protein